MNVLAINPWIMDFAAYDFWLKPYGFLSILEYLKNKGVKIIYIDCLNKKISYDTFGRGKYFSRIIEKPAILKNIPRYFKQYGIEEEYFIQLIKNIRQRTNIDFILVTSSMTYWYPALIKVVEILKSTFPNTPIILGGTYATLCKEHAMANIKYVHIVNNRELEKLFLLTDISYQENELLDTLPNYENFYNQIDYVVLRTSWGCPFNCSYCAIKLLYPNKFYRVSISKVIDYIKKYTKKGIKDFVIYDDAFLYENAYAHSLLESIVQAKLRINFHTPNALHLRFLTKKIAHLLKRSGFINPHFGLETMDPHLQKIWGDKVNKDDVVAGIEKLKKGGFGNGEFSVYLLLGYPGQDLNSLKKEAEYLHSLGAKISLAEFSPVPGTKLFEKYKHKLSEPLLHNNSIFTFFIYEQRDKLFEQMKKIWEIKNYVRYLNKKLH